jgi:hypothetical protein
MKIYFRWLFIELIIFIPIIILFFFLIVKYSISAVWVFATAMIIVVLHILVQYYAEKKGWKRNREIYVTNEDIKEYKEGEAFEKDMKRWTDDPNTLAKDLEPLLKNKELIKRLEKKGKK